MIKCEHCDAPCCRHVIPELALEGSSVCRFLDQETNRCRIYSNRPWICNTDYMFEHYYSEFMTREEYDRRNSEACDILRSNYYGKINNKENLDDGRTFDYKGSDQPNQPGS